MDSLGQLTKGRNGAFAAPSPRYIYERHPERCLGIIRTHLMPRFGGRKLSSISREEIEIYMAERLSVVAPATVNREYSRLRHILNTAVEWGYLQKSPCKGIRELKEPPGRIRYLKPDEFERLMIAVDPASLRTNPYNARRALSPLLNLYLKPLVLVSLHSGLRRGSLLSLKRENIDWEVRQIITDPTKNGDRLVTPMNETLYRELRKLPARLDTDLLFPGISPGMFTAAFRRAANRAGLENVVLHDMRHSFASYLTMSGVPLRTVQMLLGHRDIRMTLRYSHLSPEHLAGAVKALDNVFPNVPGVGPGTISNVFPAVPVTE